MMWAGPRANNMNGGVYRHLEVYLLLSFFAGLSFSRHLLQQVPTGQVISKIGSYPEDAVGRKSVTRSNREDDGRLNRDFPHTRGL